MFWQKNAKKKTEKRFSKLYPQLNEAIVGRENCEYQLKRDFDKPQKKVLLISKDLEDAKVSLSLISEGSVFGLLVPLPDYSDFCEQYPNIPVAPIVDFEGQKLKEVLQLDIRSKILFNSKPAVFLRSVANVRRPKNLMRSLQKEWQGNSLVLLRFGAETADSLNISEYLDAEAEEKPGYAFSSTRLDYQTVCKNLCEIGSRQSDLPLVRMIPGFESGCEAQSAPAMFEIARNIIENQGNDEDYIILSGFLPYSKRFGFAAKNALLAALSNKPLTPEAIKLEKGYAKLRVAVQAHIFSVEALPDILCCFDSFPAGTDFYISSDTESKLTFIRNSIEKKYPEIIMNYFCVEDYGRDLVPFLRQMSECGRQYDAICHFHSKKATRGDRNAVFRRYLLASLAGNSEIVNSILALFAEKKAGLVFADTERFSSAHKGWDDCRDLAESLLNDSGADVSTGEEVEFPLGSMFWIAQPVINRLAASAEAAAKRLGEDGSDKLCHSLCRCLPIATRLEGLQDYRIISNFSKK